MVWTVIHASGRFPKRSGSGTVTPRIARRAERARDIRATEALLDDESS
jgi:hypothetical protein